VIKAAIIGCLVGVAIVIGAMNACTIDRASDKLKCSVQSDCTGNRVCENGYCVVDYDVCPKQCDACDITANPPVCTIDVAGNSGDSVTCPSDMQCNITCHDRSSCGTINCGNGSACTISCLAHDACGTINCSDGPCAVTCSDTTACGVVNCANSCACDVTCGAGNCGTLNCPKVGSAFCTTSGNNNQPCVSAISGCSHC
jgi:hypothetical protein